MKVWLVSTGEPLPVVDEGSRLYRIGMLSRSLAERGHSVTWWSSSFDHILKRYRSTESKEVRIQENLNIMMMHASISYKKNISFRRVIHNRAVAREFLRLVENRERPEVILCCVPTLELAESAVRYGKRLDVPVILDVRDIWPEVFVSVIPEWLRSLGRLLFFREFRMASRSLSAAAGITSVSRSYLAWALKLGDRVESAASRVFPLCSSFEVPANEVKDERMNRLVSREDGAVIRICFSGTFGSSYDLETVVRAGLALEESGVKGWSITIAGDGEQAAKLKELALGNPRIKFLGWVDKEVLGELMAESNVGVCAYRKDATQSLPNKPFEYMAFGLAIFSSLTGELSEIIEREQIGLNYRPGDVEGLSQIIREMIETPRAVIEMGKRSRVIYQECYHSGVVYSQFCEYMEKTAYLWKGQKGDNV